nr:transposase [Microcystis aeruginosa]
MTILIAFHANQYRNFKSYYLEQVTQQWGQAFPKLPSYQRFIEWIPSKLLPFSVYLKHCCGQCTSISFVDSTALKVGHNRRISQHKVFKNLAQRGKTSVDCFFGFKLHLVVNERGELLNVILTTGNVDDRKPITELLPNFALFPQSKIMDSSFLTTDTDYLLAFLVATRSLREIGNDLRL